MTVFDLIVILVVVVSVGFSIWRGLVREVLALLSWIAAFWLARLFAAVGLWIRASWGAVLLIGATLIELALYLLGSPDVRISAWCRGCRSA